MEEIAKVKLENKCQGKASSAPALSSKCGRAIKEKQDARQTS